MELAAQRLGFSPFFPPKVSVSESGVLLAGRWSAPNFTVANCSSSWNEAMHSVVLFDGLVVAHLTDGL